MQSNVQLAVPLNKKYNVKDIVNNVSNTNHGSIFHNGSVFHNIVNFFEQESDALQNNHISKEKPSRTANEDIELPQDQSTQMHVADDKKLKQAKKQSEALSNSEEQSVVLPCTNHYVEDTENFTECLTTQENQTSNVLPTYEVNQITAIKEINDKKNAALLANHYQKNEVEFNNDADIKVNCQNSNSPNIEEKIANLADQKSIGSSLINKNISNDSTIDINLANKEFSLDTNTTSTAHNHAYTVVAQTTTFKPYKSYISQNTSYFSVQTTESTSIRPTSSEESSNDTSSFQQENFNYQENPKHETAEEGKYFSVKDSAYVQKEQELRMQHKISNITFDNEFFEEFYSKESKNFSLDIYPSKEEVVQVKVKFGIKKNSEISISSNIKHNLDMMIKNLDQLRHSLEEKGFNSLKFDFHHSHHQEKDDDEVMNTKSPVDSTHKKGTITHAQNIILNKGLLLDIVV